MANIRNSISLSDKMSPVLKTMLRAMDDNLKMMQRLDQQASRGTPSKAFQNAANSIDRANRQLNQMDKQMNRIHSTATGVAGSFSRMGSSGFNLTNLASALYLLKNIGNAISGIMEAPDMAKSTQARIGLFNESPYTPQQLYDQIYKTSLDTRSGLNETGNLVSRIMVSGVMKGKDSALGAIKVTDIINKALVAGGGGSEENKRALLQLSQGLSSGVLQGDELRSIREQVPYLASILAQGLGKEGLGKKFDNLDIGNLKKLGKDGELTADRIVKAFLAMEDEVNTSFDKMPKTFGQAMTSLNNIWDYFLYKMSLGEGPLGKLTEEAWKLVSFLESKNGEEFLSGMGTVIAVLVEGVLGLFNAIGQLYGFLSDNNPVLIASLYALATAFTIMGTAALIAWIEAAWPILLVMALVGGLIYLLLELGFTGAQIAGAIVGAFAFVGAALWDLLLIIAGVVVAIVVGVWDVIIWIIQALISVAALLGNAFIAAFKLLGAVLGSMVAVVEGVIYAIISLFQGLADAVLGIIWGIAKAIDFVFGSNLSKTVDGWLKDVNGAADKLHAAVNPADDTIFTKQYWTTGYIDMKKASTVTDPLIGDPTAGFKGLKDFGINPVDAYGAGSKNTESGINSFMKKLDKLDSGSSSIKDLLKDLKLGDGTVIKGGKLDSVDKINKEVDISDEDLKLLKDVAAKEFLMNVASVTPTMQVSFGDVRETADVNKILEAIETMTEEALGSILVEQG